MSYEFIRPSTLHFLKVRDTSRPTVLTWGPLDPNARELVVYSTSNAFPPEMARELFAGKMRSFVDEDTLELPVVNLRLARPDRFYAILWVDDEGNMYPVDDLREVSAIKGQQESDLLLEVASGMQVRTFLRARFLPYADDARDKAIHVWARDLEPDSVALAKMASGEIAPDFVLSPSCDGFIDTQSELDWRKFYVALAMGKDGKRRPLSLEVGPFVRLQMPAWLEPEGRRKHDKLMTLIREQLELDLQRKSISADDFYASLKRAEILAPWHSMIGQLRLAARVRFGH